MIGAAAGSVWLSLSLAESARSHETTARLMQLSRSDAGDLDLTRLQSPVIGAMIGTDGFLNTQLNAKALRLADGYLDSESRLYSHNLKTIRVSQDMRAQKAQGEPVLLNASLTNAAPRTPSAPAPAIRVSSAEPLVMRNRSQSDLECLTQALYHEARGEGTDGMRAVAQVILNRVRHPSYPNTICKVVYQGAYLRTGCQFSFACDGSMNRRTEANAWRRARKVAENALNGYVMPSVGSATHFHTTAVSPRWAPKMTRVTMVGNHVFYQFGGPKSRLNSSDSVKPSTDVPVIAAAQPKPEPALITVLAKDEATAHSPAVQVSHVVTGAPAKELGKTLAQPESPAQETAKPAPKKTAQIQSPPATETAPKSH